MKLGSKSSSERNADQTAIANFWADGGGTFTPPGHWNRIASDTSLENHQSLIDSARTMALVNVALADAGIRCCWPLYTSDAAYEKIGVCFGCTHLNQKNK